MFRQSVSKFSLLRGAMNGGNGLRGFADKKKPCSLCPDEAEQKRQKKSDEKTKTQEDPMCKHHGDMIPDFENLKNLKSFELKSDCNKFHWCSEGHNH